MTPQKANILKIRKQKIFLNESYQSIYVKPKNILGPHPKPKNSPPGPQKANILKVRKQKNLSQRKLSVYICKAKKYSGTPPEAKK